MPGIFISYRREDSPGHAGRLFDRLRVRLDRERVFMDITGIEAGVDFVDTIERAIASCDALLAVIGPEWLTCADGEGRPRLADTGDFIRIEIAAALKRNVRVIPVLVGGAVMPTAQALPDDLKPLTRRQAAELRDARWDADTDALLLVLERVLGNTARVPSVARRAVHVPDLELRSDSSIRLARENRTIIPSYRRPWAMVVLAASILGVILALIGVVPLMRRPHVQSAESRVSDARVKTPDPPAPTEKPSPEIVPTSQGASPPQGDQRPARRAEIRVPNLEGLSLNKAAQVLRDAGLTVGSRESVTASGTNPFVVMKQKPVAGSQVSRGAHVDLVYAKPTRVLPALTGLSLDDAIAELRASGFAPGELTPRPTNKAPANLVLQQSHPQGSELEPGTRVDLVYATRLR